MDLTTEELRDLATFLAKRLTPDLEPLDPTDPPPPGDPGAAWLQKLQAAQRAGRLPQLAREVAAADRSDRNLQQACDLLATGHGNLESLALGAVIVGGSAVALLAVTGTGLFLGFAGLAGAPELSAAPPPEPIEVALQPQSIEEEAPVEAAVDELDEEIEEAVAMAEAERPSRCASPDGGVVGYWYAGDEPPGAPGQLVVLDHAVNVRAEYPGSHNRFDTRAPVRCVLQAGDAVRISRDPIPVPKDRYWVPLVSGDVVSTTG